MRVEWSGVVRLGFLRAAAECLGSIGLWLTKKRLKDMVQAADRAHRRNSRYFVRLPRITICQV